jgi:hypothetical protein
MSMSKTAQQFLSAMLAVVVLAAAAGQAYASTAPKHCVCPMSAGISMSAMQAMCKDAMSHSGQNAPCKSMMGDCIGQVCCEMLSVASLTNVPAIFFYQSADRIEMSSVDRIGLSVRPALPPPILVA